MCTLSSRLLSDDITYAGTLWEWLDKRTINLIDSSTRFAEFVSPFTNIFVRNEKDGFMVLMLILQVCYDS